MSLAAVLPLLQLKHPLLCELMGCFAALLKEYKGEVEDILVADKQVGRAGAGRGSACVPQVGRAGAGHGRAGPVHVFCRWAGQGQVVHQPNQPVPKPTGPGCCTSHKLRPG